MSILFENDLGVFISHREYINSIYVNVEEPCKMNTKLFDINVPYKSHKNNENPKGDLNLKMHEKFLIEQKDVQEKFNSFMNKLVENQKLESLEVHNKLALQTSDFIYNASGRALVKNVCGANIGPATIKKINGGNFLFPENSKFFSKEVIDIEKYLKDEKYDLILLDPPWWNKYIRRKRKKCEDVYKMLFNKDIQNLPIESLLKDNGIVIVWCTNSYQHVNDLISNIFPKWKVEFIGKWYWVKITLSGKPVCPFSPPPGKQPYEQIIFGCRGSLSSIPFNSKLIVSIPSAIHSHKPPLIELLKVFLPDNPSCLEIFARYLLPNWSSYGNEVLRFQHESVFQ